MRDLDPVLQTGAVADVIWPVVLALLTFRSGVEYVCSAGFNITWNGNTFKGIGTLGGISPVSEGTEVKADGMALTLSGIDPEIMGECLTDIQPLAPAKIWVGLMNGAQLIGTPYRYFAGVVDTPEITVAVPTSSITLKLETRMALLNRGSQRRYTSADQHANGYPDDSAFSWVERLNDICLRWGN